tara:strand:- start:34 stop:255 length:222 start_codon:yes stop_codon:yes gene_type:complete
MTAVGEISETERMAGIAKIGVPTIVPARVNLKKQRAQTVARVSKGAESVADLPESANQQRPMLAARNPRIPIQ